MNKIIRVQFGVLLAGTLFAWVNFGIEVASWLGKKSNPFSCTAGQLVNPFLTPCFYGAIFFTIAFALSVMLLLQKKDEPGK